MIIGGFQKQSLIDYPGKITSIVFTNGCNFRCGYCHNGSLIDGQKNQVFEIDEVIKYLKENLNLLDAVTITGGEPTIHSGLFNFIFNIKQLGLAVKLDTNGTNPQILKKLIDAKLLDFIAMDIKAPVEKSRYSKIVGVNLSDETMDNIKSSIELIKNSNVDHEFRTTLISNCHSKDDIIRMANDIKGAKKYSLQTFRNETVFDDIYASYKPILRADLKDVVEKLKIDIGEVIVR